MLLGKRSMAAASEIYGVYKKRVIERAAVVEQLLKEHEFSFTTDEFIARDREDAAWPKNAEDAKNLWRLQLKAALLAEN